MKRNVALALFAALTMAGAPNDRAGSAPAAPTGGGAHPIALTDLTSRPRPKGAQRIRYGAGPAQFVDLWRPEGRGPFPVVIMIHGGCWQAAYGLDLMDWAAEDLRRRGVAVWNIEYRRLGEAGGGYPGTFRDVGAALDLLAKEAHAHGLKLTRTTAVGHSAGGHLALWAAARGRIPASSPLHAAHPLRIDAVVSVGGLGDLESPSQACGGAQTITDLIGPASKARPNPMADTSPVFLEPFPARQVLVHGALDHIAPAAFGEAYRDKAARRGGKAELVVVPGQAHFDLIAPGTPAWETVIRPAILGELRQGRMGGQGATPDPGKAKVE